MYSLLRVMKSWEVMSYVERFFPVVPVSTLGNHIIYLVHILLCNNFCSDYEQ